MNFKLIIYQCTAFIQVQQLGGHNSYFGCQHCRIAGEWFGHVYYPLPTDRRARRKQLKARKAKRIKYQAARVNRKIIYNAFSLR